ncbi:exopolysaccharide production protein ExoZ [Rhizobium wenxiniae]|uniref:Exopolysaccharide production protein ExoZ n=1 Tax=Rhizobium wenxiniae TaxID=1737357 RepID=A0A7W9Y2Z4_9HYPH|nr:acyltransferase [Rhizobium wenxiniae]MBB6161059.1 exopolysaccharide production protein ExoZ [Rhizobium wenxiniae]
MIVLLHYLRAVAALLVVYGHLGGFEYFHALGKVDLNGIGSAIFFVISGFLLWGTSNPKPIVKFLAVRFLRLVPLYWLYTSVLVCLAIVAPSLTPRISLSPEHIVYSYLFIPYLNDFNQINPLLLQAWTLNYEIYFSFIFAISLMVDGPRLRLALLTMFIVLSFTIGLIAPSESAVIKFYTGSMLLCFLFGIWARITYRKIAHSLTVGSLSAVLGGGGLIAAGLFLPALEPRGLIYGVPSAVLLVGLSILSNRISKADGLLKSVADCTYTLFLSHPFVLAGVAMGFRVVDRALFPVNGIVGALSFGIVGIVASILFALVAHRVIEQPINRVSNMIRLSLWPSSPRVSPRTA